MANSVAFAPAAVTAAVDLFELYAQDGATAKVASIHLGQTSDLGDAQSEILPYEFIVGYTGSGSAGGSALDGSLGDSGNAGVGREVLNTTPASGGTYLVSEGPVRGFNIQVGEQWDIPEGLEPRCVGGIDGTNADLGRLVVRLLAAPADSLTMFGTLIFVCTPGL